MSYVIDAKNQEIEELKAEVKSLNHDWLMCDAVCDKKTEKNRELSKLAWEVVKYQHEWDDDLSEAITKLDDYLKDQIVSEIRTNMSNEKIIPIIETRRRTKL